MKSDILNRNEWLYNEPYVRWSEMASGNGLTISTGLKKKERKKENETKQKNKA